MLIFGSAERALFPWQSEAGRDVRRPSERPSTKNGCLSTWLGAGAVTLGMGIGVVSGTAVAFADAGDAGEAVGRVAAVAT